VQEKIFPVTKRPHRTQKGEYEWMICGFVLPHSNFDGYEEEQTATALGLVCHVVSMLAKYLDVCFALLVIFVFFVFAISIYPDPVDTTSLHSYPEMFPFRCHQHPVSI
jgi:hypothetical protein